MKDEKMAGEELELLEAASFFFCSTSKTKSREAEERKNTKTHKVIVIEIILHNSLPGKKIYETCLFKI